MKRVYLSAVTFDVLHRPMYVAFGRCAGAVFATSANVLVLAHALSLLVRAQCRRTDTSASDLGDDSLTSSPSCPSRWQNSRSRCCPAEIKTSRIIVSGRAAVRCAWGQGDYTAVVYTNTRGLNVD
jgi:hypothetical protein